jgi:hypothetical protein
MWARVASFEGGDTERMRQLNEEAMSSGTMDVPAGMKRALVLASEDGSKRMFVSFFDDRGALDAAEEGFDRMGDTIPEEVRGRRTAVDVYQVVFEGEM